MVDLNQSVDVQITAYKVAGDTAASVNLAEISNYNSERLAAIAENRVFLSGLGVGFMLVFLVILLTIFGHVWRLTKEQRAELSLMGQIEVFWLGLRRFIQTGILDHKKFAYRLVRSSKMLGIVLMVILASNIMVSMQMRQLTKEVTWAQLPEDTYESGDVVQYNIMYTNTSDQPIQGIELINSLPNVVILDKSLVWDGRKLSELELSQMRDNGYSIDKPKLETTLKTSENRQRVLRLIELVLEPGESHVLNYKALVVEDNPYQALTNKVQINADDALLSLVQVNKFSISE